MATISAGDFRKGVTFEMDGKVMTVVDFQHVKPGKGAAFVRTKYKNVMTGAVREEAFHHSLLELGAGVEGLLADCTGHHVSVLGTHESSALAGLNVLEVDDGHDLAVHLKGNSLTEIASSNRCHICFLLTNL